MLAIEACIIESLPTLFPPEDILDIDDAMVATLAAEDEDSSRERERCRNKLKILEDGLRELKRVQEHPSLQNNSKPRS